MKKKGTNHGHFQFQFSWKLENLNSRNCYGVWDVLDNAGVARLHVGNFSSVDSESVSDVSQRSDEVTFFDARRSEEIEKDKITEV